MIRINVQLPNGPTAIQDMATVLHAALVAGGRAYVESERSSFSNDNGEIGDLELEKFTHDPDGKDAKILK